MDLLRRHRHGRMARLAMACVLATVLLACGPRTPVRIGFLGGAATQGFNVSEDGRNGALLAVETINRAGGIRGRPLELVVRDITHEPDRMQGLAEALMSAQVEAAIGPFTSTQVLAMLPQADAAGLLLVSPTANAPELAGRDDHFIRLNGALSDSAGAYARVLVGRGQKRIAVAFDQSNAAYSVQWLGALRARLAALGGQVVAEAGFVSGKALSYGDIARPLLAAEADGVLFICRGADAASLAQQVRKHHAGLPLAAAEWAATDSLIELGGRAAEGLVTAQPYDPGDPSAGYQAFRARYRERYAREPSFGALGAYDAVTVLAQALSRREGRDSLKDAVLRHGPYQGLQHAITFDRFGDSTRPLHFVEVRDGAFVALR